jgi:hypothetical protein
MAFNGWIQDVENPATGLFYTPQYSSNTDLPNQPNQYGSLADILNPNAKKQRPKFDWNQMLKSMLVSGIGAQSGNRGLGMLGGIFAPQIEKWITTLAAKKKKTGDTGNTFTTQPVGSGQIYTGQ